MAFSHRWGEPCTQRRTVRRIQLTFEMCVRGNDREIGQEKRPQDGVSESSDSLLPV